MKSQKGSISAELFLTGISLIFIIIFLLFSRGIDAYVCSNYGSLTERTTKFSIVNGCFVKTDSGWIPQEEMSKRAYGNSITESTKNE